MQALKKIESVWKNLEFQFSQHKNTDVMMIKLSEEDFETLEDHQVLIQRLGICCRGMLIIPQRHVYFLYDILKNELFLSQKFSRSFESSDLDGIFSA